MAKKNEQNIIFKSDIFEYKSLGNIAKAIVDYIFDVDNFDAIKQKKLFKVNKSYIAIKTDVISPNSNFLPNFLTHSGGNYNNDGRVFVEKVYSLNLDNSGNKNCRLYRDWDSDRKDNKTKGNNSLKALVGIVNYCYQGILEIKISEEFEEIEGKKKKILLYSLYSKNSNEVKTIWHYYSLPKNDENDDLQDNEQPLNQILYGPPGTGKTYNTVIRAMEIIDSNSLKYDDKGCVSNYNEVKAKFDELKKQGRIEFITFHQSYGYEDFIEGIKPAIGDENEDVVDYVIVDGIFKRILNNALFDRLDIASNKINKVLEFKYLKEKFKDKFQIGDVLETINKKKFEILGYNSKGRLKIKPEGSSHDDYTINFNILEEIFNRGDNPDKPSYFDNIEGAKGYTPWYFSIYNEFKTIYEEENNKISNNKNIIQEEEKLNLINDYYAGIIKLKDIKDSNPYVLIIDEINRGNISKILGELITLLEDDKRENFSVKLPYSHEEFTVPKNLYIIGTMNTADRSIALMDTALRRRFEFVEMMPKPELMNFEVEGIKLNDMISKMNERIEALYDREHTIGHAFFMPLKENGTIRELGKIFKNKIIPLLQEYFYDDYSKIQLVLGDNQDNVAKFIIDEPIEKNKLFKGNIDKVRISNDKKRYSINNDAFENSEAYKKIYE